MIFINNLIHILWELTLLSLPITAVIGAGMRTPINSLIKVISWEIYLAILLSIVGIITETLNAKPNAKPDPKTDPRANKREWRA
jgi:hypothetical protein